MANEMDLSPELRERPGEPGEGLGWPYVRPSETFEVVTPATSATPRAEMLPELIDELTTAVD